MNSRAPVVVAICLFSCATTDGSRVEDGGLVDSEGWPSRRFADDMPVDLRTLRCPANTDLRDQIFSDGRRRVVCLVRGTTHLMGFRLSWHTTGSKASDLRFDSRGLPSQKTTWHEDGTKKSEAFYEGTRTTRSATWYGSGTPRSVRLQSEEDGLIEVQRWQLDGEIEAEGKLRGRVKVGDWREWRKGALESRTYVDGLATGAVERRYPDGGHEVGKYHEGVRSGKWKRVDAQRSPVHEVNYEGGLREGRSLVWHPNGQVRNQSEFSRGRLHGRHGVWYPSGQIKQEGAHDCGDKVGLWTAWYSEGSKEARGYFVNGHRAGLWMKWSPTGEVLQEEFLDVPVDQQGRPVQTVTTPDGVPFEPSEVCQPPEQVKEDEIEKIRDAGAKRDK